MGYEWETCDLQGNSLTIHFLSWGVTDGRFNTACLRKRHIPWWSAQNLLLHGMSRIHGRLKQIRSRWTRHFWARWHRCYGCHLQSRTMHGAGHANKKVLTICYMLCTMYWYAKYGGCIGRKQNSILQAVIATRWYLLWVDISKFSHGACGIATQQHTLLGQAILHE
jgi:hypothetical protein